MQAAPTTTQDIVTLVKSRRITPEEGLRLYQAAQPANRNGAVSTPTRTRTPAPEIRTLDIAVVGLSGRYPGSRDAREFWRNLRAGKAAIQGVPAERWDAEAIYHPIGKEGYKSVSKWGGFIDGIDEFDSLFFNISPREAELMDPQQRLFLQEAWSALEDAGYHERNLDGRKCGVFVGCKAGDYQTLLDLGRETEGAFIFMGNNESILAARIAYFLNLRGPTVAVDTACSSSLVSIHLACDSLLSGTCEMAIAGGAALLTTPTFHVLASKAGMLSGSASCKTFDQSADGFVPGEGVGAIVLKPLSAALRDGDPIYGVIKGSGINQDGRTNGITAPSAPSQTALQREVYERFGINPESLSYVEAHGTGTKLGDPIEVQALTDAFRAQSKKQHFCALGSVKTNIGHALAAAGIAGFTKLLLQLKHGEIAPSLNFTAGNEHIDFAHSPFVVNERLQPWIQQANRPRRGAISAFGFSGTNAHLVVEEAPVAVRRSPPPLRLAVVSARNEEALRRQVQRLAEWLESDEGREAELHDVFYTLLVRRTHFSTRVAFVVRDRAELLAKLRGVLAGSVALMTLKKNRPVEIDTAAMTEAEALLEQLAAGEKIDHESWPTLVTGFLCGWNLKWDRLARTGYRCVSLPTYSFATDKHWVTSPAVSPQSREKAPSSGHPFVQANVSTLEVERFETRLTAADFVLKDHVVVGEPILPGVAYLEMARAAGAVAGGRTVTNLRKIVWARTGALTGGELALAVEFFPRADRDEADFEILNADTTGDEAIYCQGQLSWCSKPTLQNERLDLAAVRTRCGNVFGAEACYSAFANRGLNYGPGFRSLTEVFSGPGEVLARIVLPDHLRPGAELLMLHPSLMDGALQSLVGFVLAEPGNQDTYVPFSLENVEIFRALPSTVWAQVWIAAGAHATAAATTFDLQIADDSGLICAKLTGLTMRRLALSVPATLPATTPRSRTESVHYYRPTWRSTPMPDARPLSGRVLLFSSSDQVRVAGELSVADRGQVIQVKPGRDYRFWAGLTYEIDPRESAHYETLLRTLQAQEKYPDCIVHLWSEEIGDDTSLEDSMARTGWSLLALARALSAVDARPIPIFFVNREGAGGPSVWHLAATGLARTLAAERRPVSVRVLSLAAPIGASRISDDRLWSTIAAEITTDEPAPAEGIRYHGTERSKRDWLSWTPSGEPSQFSVRANGVYWITGGLGGIGRAIAQWLARQANVVVVLTGRSVPTAEGNSWLEHFSGTGSRAIYLRSDLAARTDVEKTRTEIKARYGHLNGIVHAAGITRDTRLCDKTWADARAVFGPKIEGARHLDEVTREEPLDFFVVCAALAGVIGNAGQADYAYANGFLDQFSAWREDERRAGRRQGITCAVDWPLWRDGGMKMDADSIQLMKTAVGIEPLETDLAVAALGAMLAGPGGQTVVVQGDPIRFQRILGVSKVSASPSAIWSPKLASPAPGPVAGALVSDLKPAVQKTLLQIVSTLLKVKEKDLDVTVEMSEFGFDSIGLTQLANRINEHYGLEIMPAVLFEHPTLLTFIDFLCREHTDTLSRKHALAPAPSPTGEIPPSTAIAPAELPDLSRLPRRGRRARFTAKTAVSSETQKVAETVYGAEPTPAQPARSRICAPLAIIGLAGRMPQSPDLETFWQHLERGDDLISEIPPDRWDWREIYGDPAREANKTNIKWGGFMPGVDEFDALFFGISPREAELMDPQQRLFLQAVWGAIENAGYRPSALAGTRTGLFAGVTTADYLELLKANDVEIQAQSSTGVAHSILVNRISFLLNLRGPSEPVDTACSSALVALHHAAESIWNGHCDLALAGGVNAILTPTLHIGFSRAGMLAHDGRCKSFDQGANGYVRGEGVGVVLLKPLDRALADGDHIHAVLRGSAINHGGRANSLTAPNPNAQAEVIGEALQRANVDPDSLGYVETHGTGTSLGDPIEINGLKKAFETIRTQQGRKVDPDTRIALGSVKSNVGHLEAAAGMAGLFKVILAFQHQRIPATLHIREVNPYIQLAGTGLEIAREAQGWPRRKNGNGEPQPRRAGVSSFGFGGMNAHLVLEEFSLPEATPSATGPHLLVLSAKTRERLQAYAKNIADFLNRAEADPTLARGLSPERFVYTLQTGREAMEERLAMVIHTLTDAREKLARFATSGAEGLDNAWAANAREQRTHLDGLIGGDEGTEFLRLLRDRRRWDKLGMLWTAGLDLDWGAFYTAKSPGRIPLPAYPFSPTRYWIPTPTVRARPSALLGNFDAGRSLGAGVSWTRSLRPEERVVADHRVRNEAIMPAAGYVELAIEAWAQLGRDYPVAVRNLVLPQPLIVGDEPTEFRVSVTTLNEGVDFEISSGKTSTKHARGSLAALPANEAASVMDLAAVEARCSRIVPGEEVIRAFERRGLAYGPFYRALRQLRSGADEALGRLELTPEALPLLSRCAVHPGLLDAAFQTIAGAANADEADRAWLPFSIEEIVCYRPAPAKAWAYARRAGTHSFHVALLDDEGRVCVRVTNLQLREPPDLLDGWLYRPSWKLAPALAAPALVAEGTTLIVTTPVDGGLAQAIATSCAAAAPKLFSVERVGSEGWLEELSRQGPVARVIFLGGVSTRSRSLMEPADLEESQRWGVRALLHLTQALSRQGGRDREVSWTIVTSGVQALTAEERNQPWGADLVGFTKAMAKEYSRWRIACLDLPMIGGADAPLTQFADAVLQEPAHPRGDEITWRAGQRFARSMESISLRSSSVSRFRNGGVYFLIGGAGGLGLEFARHLASNYQARLALVGRTAPSPELQQKLDQLTQAGGSPLYLQADAADPDALTRALEQTEARFGAIHGIVHTAIVLKDRTIERMSEADLTTVLAPKAAVSVALHRAIAGRKLDFLLFFSSAQSFAGNAGQANYAAGCTFEDAYASALRSQLGCPVKVINWGYWGTVGVVSSDKYNQDLAQRGLRSIAPHEGLEAIERILAHDVDQVMPIKADPALLASMGVETSIHRIQTLSTSPRLVDELVREGQLTSTMENDLRDGLESFQQLQTWGRRLLATVLREMGAFASVGASRPAQGWADDLRIAPQHRRLWEALISSLSRAGDLERRDGLVMVKAIAEDEALRRRPEAIAAEKTALVAAYPELAPFARLLEICVRAYPDILTGRRSSMEVMFPGGSMELVEAIYRGNRLQDAHNRLVARAVADCVQRHRRIAPDGVIRILELGAGTGGTSHAVLEALGAKTEKVIYTYTDVSNGFVRYGEQKFGSLYPFCEFKTLDLEQPPEAQGFAAGTYDLVFASNVLHATRRISRTLEAAKTLLKRHGVIAINELTRTQDFGTLTFGLIEGWWLFEDGEGRLPESPLLSASLWAAQLRTAGFERFHALGQEVSDADERVQSVMIAESDGWVLKRASGPTEVRGYVSSQAEPTAPTPAKPAMALPPSVVPAARVVSAPIADLGARTKDYVRGIFSRVLKLAPGALPGGETFERFGVDSLVVLQLNEQFEKDLGQLPSTLLFECMTIDALAARFVAQYRDRLEKALGSITPVAIAVNPSQSDDPFAATLPSGSTGTPSPEGSGSSSLIPQTTEPPSLPVEKSHDLPNTEEIAIIGVGGRYPLADTLPEFWENLRAGRHCIREVPKDRWDWQAYAGAKNEPDRIYTPWGGFVDGMDQFDPTFFNLPPKEAEHIDPQERVFLQTAWETFEEAGLNRARRETLDDRIGVFVGAMNGGYGRSGPSYWSIANRLSYFLNLSGPSFAVDSACSSSLTAVHLACESLRRGECRAALAGGVNVIVGPEHYLDRCAVNMLSPGESCRAFGEGADGFVTGEGVGAVLLMPRRTAESMGLRILALIKGTAVNSGGKTGGYTVPNPNAQAEVVRRALRNADVDSRTISYLEAHGTGTALGDPIEIAGLGEAFGAKVPRGSCSIGSVKSNVGHLEAAAGIAALTKVLLQMQNGELAPSLHAEKLNPHIHFETTPFTVARQLMPWRPSETVIDGVPRVWPRRAGVSSFGAGGANAHVILEEVDSPLPAPRHAPGPRLYVLSAKSEKRLRTYAAHLAAFLRKETDRLLPDDVAWTLLNRRERMDFRLGIIADDLAELVEKLDGYALGEQGMEDVFGSLVQPGSGRRPGRDLLRSLARQWKTKSEIDEVGAVGGRHVWLPVCPFETIRLWHPGKAAALAAPAKDAPVNSPADADSVAGEKRVSVASAAALASTQAVLRQCLTDQLGVDGATLPDEQAFTDLGIDSIHATKLTVKLNRLLKLDLVPTAFMNFPTLGDYAAHLATLVPPDAAPANAAPIVADLPSSRNDEPTTQRVAATGSRDIAVIGLSGRFPGADNLEQFWSNLCQGVDAVRDIPAERWDVGSYYDPRPNQPGKTVTKRAGLIDGVDQFDAPFFDLMAMEASMIDPQQRLFLEEAWRALEGAGCTAERLANRKCGVFVGCGTGDYTRVIGDTQPLNAFAMMGNHTAVLPARVSYFLNLKGPAIAVDTACSSSLVAIHQACTSLWTGESELAVAGGVHLTLTPLAQLLSSAAGMLSPDGRCRTFDNNANGIVIGEAVGAVVLKPLDRARADGDRIWAVIKGSGVNQDGRTNGLTAPNALAQAALEQEVYENAGINPDSISYVETHGTGTKLGDPIEVEGLTRAFRKFTERKGFCALASLKPNIGHAYQAAGIASFIKTVLALQHRQIPPSLHVDQVNEHLRLEESPFYVNQVLKNWLPSAGSPRRAAVSSFGYSGTNAHLVLEEYAEPIAQDAAETTATTEVIVVSARTEKRLRIYASTLRARLLEMSPTARREIRLRDLAYTLQVGRTNYAARLALVVRDVNEAIQLLGVFGDGLIAPERLFTGTVKRGGPPKSAVTIKPDPVEWARRWTQGETVDWSAVRGSERGRLLNLPLAPFLRVRCWPKSPATPLVPTTETVVAPTSEITEVPKTAVPAVSPIEIASVLPSLAAPTAAPLPAVPPPELRQLDPFSDKLAPSVSNRTLPVDLSCIKTIDTLYFL